MESKLSYLLLSGGKVYDPTNGIDGQPKDIWIKDGKIVDPPTGDESVRTIDLTGYTVMAGAVDMHCHIAGPKVNTARKMQPEQMRQVSECLDYDAPMASVPDIYTTGLRYTGLGYTSCFDAAVTPMASRHVHHEFDAVPNIDKGFFVLVGNNHYALDCIANKDSRRLKSFLGWVMNRCGAYAPKIVNPGGVEMWKQRASGNAKDMEQNIEGFDVTPHDIVTSLTSAANELNLPHPVHIHCNNLGVPGNFETTLATMKAVAGQRAHLTHIQFHSYGGKGTNESVMCSKVQPLAEIIENNPDLTVDVGQVMFGETTSMTADGPLGYYLHSIGGEKWFSADIELESGCGVSPIKYRNKNYVHALQWAIGLEWYLTVTNPWQVVMSSDHPNGGSFLAYPMIIRLLMDSAYRREQLKLVHPNVLKHSNLPDLDREYSLSEIAIITRAGPAKILGLENKGHLGVGADADITVYTPNSNFETMFAWPKMVVKAGEILVEDGEFRKQIVGNLIEACPEYNQELDQSIESWFEKRLSYPLNPIQI